MSRPTTDLCLFILRREGKFKIVEEGNDHGLHLKHSTENLSDRNLVHEEPSWRPGCTHANRQPMHTRRPLPKRVVVSEDAREYEP